MAVTDPDQMRRQAMQYTEQGQAATADMVRALSEGWAGAVRTATGVGAGSLSAPSPAEIVDRSFDFTVQMIEAQRSFAHQLLRAGAPAARAMEQVTDSLVERARQGTSTDTSTDDHVAPHHDG